jgi:hypothetical protein
MPKTTPSLSFIVAATGPNDRICKKDLDAAHKRRPSIVRTNECVLVDLMRTASDEEGADHLMTTQLMAYLTSQPVRPKAADAPFCNALAHTYFPRSITATVDCSLASFRRPHLAFDADELLEHVMESEAARAGLFAPFAAAHVKKVLRVLPNFHIKMDKEGNDLARDYHVEMCVLTGMGILVARGELRLPRDQAESVTSTSVVVSFTGCHINWHTWGFDAERRWSRPWKTAYLGHPFDSGGVTLA